jgi:hypothetical protein
VVAVEVLGAGLWAVLGLVGAWLLLTGRKTIYGLPKGIPGGWPLRVWGGAYLALAVYLIYEAFRSSFSPSGIVTTYILLALALVLVLNRRRTTRGSGTTGRV